jgi:pimeloyl-ACP methyl ester carboxylesterase
MATRIKRHLLTGLAVIVAVLGIGWILLQRPDIPYADLETRYASPASQYLDLPDGVRVHYRDQGLRSGPTLVLVHGFSASLHAWEPWVKALEPHYRIITLDLPGHGLTRAPAGYLVAPGGFEAVVDTVTRRLDIPRFTLGGNSMGGGVAWRYALKHPDRLDGLVLVDAAGWPRTGKGGILIFQILKNPVGRALLKNIETRPLVKQGLVDGYLDPALVTPALIDRYTELARAPGHRDILLGLQTGPGDPASAARLAAIRIPTLVMFGEEDRVIPAGDGKKFAAAIPGATLILYPKVGHAPMEQIPERSAADLKTWLDAKVYPAAVSPEAAKP